MNVDVESLVVGELVQVAPVLARGIDVDDGGFGNPNGFGGVTESMRRVMDLAAQARQAQIVQAGIHFGFQLHDGAGLGIDPQRANHGQGIIFSTQTKRGGRGGAGNGSKSNPGVGNAADGFRAGGLEHVAGFVHGMGHQEQASKAGGHEQGASRIAKGGIVGFASLVKFNGSAGGGGFKLIIVGGVLAVEGVAAVVQNDLGDGFLASKV